jgi:hypothetical protein
MYEINCDGCADTLADDGDNIIFEYPSVAKEIARECEWREVEGEWFCPQCSKRLLVYDEETDSYKKKWNLN